MPKRLAITIAGAVSLGGYEAGVLYEVLKALGGHNTAAKTEDEKIYIDVITGASAGAMTAAMAAQRLLYKPSDLDGPQTNAFYQAWVERINLWSLVKMKWKEKIWHSLLSSDLIELIGKQMLIDPLKNGAAMTEVHPAIEVERDGNGKPKRDASGNLFPKPLWLWMALTNLNGLNYGYPLLDGRGARFQYTRCVDQISEQVVVPPADAVQLWTRLRDGAVASGAFPFAFRPQDIVRHRQEYDDTTLEDWAKHPPSDKTFTYTDGGVLQNQPIGLAKNLIDKLVQERLAKGDATAYDDADSRLYLFVSPHSLQSDVSVGFTAEKASFPHMTDEFVRTYARQAQFHDWIMAEQMNQQVNALDERAKQLADVIKSRQVDVNTLLTASTQLAKLLAEGDVVQLESDLNRLKIQYRELYQEMTAIGPVAADAWLNSIFTLERAANLQTRDRMNILAVMAEGRNDLAGAGISSFVGFFSRKFRDHDYLVGRIKAREYLAKPEVRKILGEIKVDGEELPDPKDMVKAPVKLWRALWAGGPALLWIAIWRLIRLALSGVGITVIVVLAALAFFLFEHYLR
jgi:predicted acylesterase/phospholipase RssA